MIFIIAWLAIVAAARYIEHRAATRRHVKLAKEVFNEELRHLRAESLSTPGGR
jgi:hypothetical protein